MTINATININGVEYKFETNEVDKAIKAIVLLTGKAEGEDNNAVEVLTSIADNPDDMTEEEDDEYVEDEDDDEVYDSAYEEGYDAGYSGLCCFGDNPYDRGTVAYNGWEEGFRDGVDDYDR